MDEDIFPAPFLLDEAEALVRVEEFHDALAGADHLGRHAATATAAGPAAACAAAETTTAAARSATEAVTTATATEAIAASEPVATPETIPAKTITASERVEAVFAKTVPLVASPAATSSIKTHEP